MFTGSEEPLAIEGVSLPLSLDDPRRILRPLDPVFTSAGYFPHLRALSLLNRSVRTLPSKLHVPKKDRTGVDDCDTSDRSKCLRYYSEGVGGCDTTVHG